ncbi:conserved hypothetical protein (plasmid) [Ilyobacter polytropus DSM 2926]|uniref:UspA domain-containing protein n=2 Tax=Ilyobacter TaxID=167639 RepID=E3HC62_ILYPC|nr:conserved hypothetical protein [Ilyobacter polytropus DSM 2926]
MIKLFNRMLVSFQNEEEVEYLTRYAKVIKEKYSGIEVVGLFVKPIEGVMKYDYLKGYYPTSTEWEYIEKTIRFEKEAEEKKKEKIKKKFLSLMGDSKFYIRSGDLAEVLLEEMKLFDVLVISKPKDIGHELKALFKNHYRPVIFVPKLENYSFEKILVANDHRFEFYKSLFSFMGIFEKVKTIDSISVNVREEDRENVNIYFNKAGRNIECFYEDGDITNVILEYSKRYDLLLMGDLQQSFIFEKVTGKPGIKIIKEIDKPIFMG